jgi:uncharacterized iron-regulated membrane protein
VSKASLFALHAGLGLALALPASALGLAGGALLFGDALDRLLSPGLTDVTPGPSRRPFEEALSAARAAEPGASATFVRVPSDPRGALEVWLGADGDRRVFVDPYTARVLGARGAGEGLRGRLMRGHMRFFLGDAGRVPVALVGTALAAQCLLGLWLLAVSRGRAAEGAALWHRRLGAGVGGLLVLQAAFGALLAVPEPRRTVMRLGGVAPDRPARVDPLVGAPDLTLDAAVAAAAAALPGGRLSSVELPADEGGALKVCFNMGLAAYPEGRECAEVHPSAPTVLAVHHGLTPEAPLARRANDILYGLHSGRWGGAPGVLSHVLLALAPLALAATAWAARRRRLASAGGAA